MKTIAKLMALAVLLGSLAFAQEKKADDTKKPADAKTADTKKPAKEKKAKTKKSKKKGAEEKPAAAAADKK